MKITLRIYDYEITFDSRAMDNHYLETISVTVNPSKKNYLNDEFLDC